MDEERVFQDPVVEDRSQDEADPILLEVMKGEFMTIVEEMVTVIGRTCRSFGAREGGDYSGALVSVDGQVIARSGIAVWYVGNTIPYVLARFGNRLKPGDIVIHNDPYSGGTHLPDIVLIMPVFYDGELIAYVGDSVHHSDIGGFAAGGMSTAPTELFQEGLLLPRVLLYDGGEPVAPVFEIIEANTRAPVDVMGDLESQVAGCIAAGRAVQRLAAKYGADVMSAYARHVVSYTEKAVRRAIRSIPNGSYRVEELIQGTAVVPPIKVVLSLQIDDDSMTIDFSGSDPQSASALNVPPSTVAGNVLRDFHHLFEIDVPSNSGLLTPITIVAPEGTVLNPRPPAAVGARSAICNKIGAMLFSALGLAMPDRVPADYQTGAPILIYTPDSDDGKSDQIVFDLWMGSRGATPAMDAMDGPLGWKRISAEMMERDSSIVLEGFGMVPDTGGAGRYRGGLGIFRKWRVLAAGRLWLRNLYSGTAATGLLGGTAGSPGVVRITTADGTTDYSDQDVVEIRVEAGDVIYQMCGGGGGHGEPLSRAVERVAVDVLEGKVSAGQARELYGVVVDAELDVDVYATHRLRELTRQAR